MLLEQLHCNLLFRWFVGLSPDDPIWHPNTFTLTEAAGRAWRSHQGISVASSSATTPTAPAPIPTLYWPENRTPIRPLPSHRGHGLMDNRHDLS